MPELPEVETIRRDLAPELEGRRIVRATIRKPDLLLGPRTRPGFLRRIEGRRIERIGRRAKYLLFHLEPAGVMQVQLRMSGRFALGEVLPDPAEFTHVVAEFALDDGRTLFYDDVRRLGGFRLYDPAEWAVAEAALGPEPLDPDFTARRLELALAGSRAPVKNALMNQARVAGLGNIYASETLHRAAIDPRRPAGGLRPAELGRLHRAIRHVLRRALERAGTTFRDYRAVNGRRGEFQSALRVYAREGEPCARCGGEIRRIVQAGRSTFFCADCQG
ncbi:MAG: bifunctional DNA-formamidopyrimidine glycosylase/DNA-(apurinic or apyrimidinic site) lyase [Gemmatimonadota bacterium]